MTDIATTVSELTEEMRYAQALTLQPERGGAQSLLPAAYRGNPANVLIAIGLGKAIGITPAQALYEIYVVNGRPSPSANLMAALVRRAGHKLRVRGDSESCTATLIRADDPGTPFEATWTIEQARKIGLATKDTWKQYPAAMLRARAIAEVVRAGASEAVIGMDYSAEEMRDQPPATTAAEKPTVDSIVHGPAQDDIHDAEVVENTPAEPEPGWSRPGISPNQLKALHASFHDIGITDRQLGLEYIAEKIGRRVDSTKDLTRDEASAVLDALKHDAEPEDPPRE